MLEQKVTDELAVIVEQLYPYLDKVICVAYFHLTEEIEFLTSES